MNVEFLPTSVGHKFLHNLCNIKILDYDHCTTDTNTVILLQAEIDTANFEPLDNIKAYVSQIHNHKYKLVFRPIKSYDKLDIEYRPEFKKLTLQLNICNHCHDFSIILGEQITCSKKLPYSKIILKYKSSRISIILHKFTGYDSDDDPVYIKDKYLEHDILSEEILKHIYPTFNTPTHYLKFLASDVDIIPFHEYSNDNFNCDRSGLIILKPCRYFEIKYSDEKLGSKHSYIHDTTTIVQNKEDDKQLMINESKIIITINHILCLKFCVFNGILIAYRNNPSLLNVDEQLWVNYKLCFDNVDKALNNNYWDIYKYR